MTTMTKMQRARAKMLLKHPFFATLMMSTPCIEKPDLVPPTMATDMMKIYYHPDFVEKIDEEAVVFVLAHEVLHIAFEHGVRLQMRHPILWNIAADYAINLVLKDSGFDVLESALIDEKYRGMSADQIYDLLRKECDKQAKKGKGKGDPQQMFGDAGGMVGDLKEPEGAGDPASEAAMKRSIQQRVAQAANVARMAGKLPASLERFVDEILNPKVPWQSLLREYMTRICKDNESWSRRNRRFQNVYLPARYDIKKMGPIVLIGDTSGSIGNDELVKYMSEAAAIAEEVRPEHIRIMWADTRVAGEQVFEEGEPITPKPMGGGGTDMRVPLREAEQYEPEVVVLFTDGYTPWPDGEPPFPLIVCCTTETEVPIGIDVRI
jgi:predicted metal-dependent peptidase